MLRDDIERSEVRNSAPRMLYERKSHLRMTGSKNDTVDTRELPEERKEEKTEERACRRGFIPI